MTQGKHVQFRLHPQKSEDENVAINVLTHWTGQGYDIRYVMTCALLALDGYDLPPLVPDDMEIIDQLLKKMGSHIKETIRESVGDQFSMNESNTREFTRVSTPTVTSPIDNSSKGGETKRFAQKYSAAHQKGLRDDE